MDFLQNDANFLQPSRYPRFSLDVNSIASNGLYYMQKLYFGPMWLKNLSYCHWQACKVQFGRNWWDNFRRFLPKWRWSHRGASFKWGWKLFYGIPMTCGKRGTVALGREKSYFLSEIWHFCKNPAFLPYGILPIWTSKM